MRDYLLFLLVGTVIQFYWGLSEVMRISVVIIELRLLSTIMGLFSGKLKLNDDFILALKCALVGLLVDRLFGANNTLDAFNIYLEFQIVFVILIGFHFLVHNPAVKLNHFIISIHKVELLSIPYKCRKIRRLTLNDTLLFVMVLSSIEFIVFYRFLSENLTLLYWGIHQFAERIQAGAFLLIGISGWLHRRRRYFGIS